MEVQFSAEQEAQISQIALQQGTDPMQLVKMQPCACYLKSSSTAQPFVKVL